ncbi:hypothetical protein ABBQ32_009354 [Trebouxia sp. C0010 RCD-2024]
MVKSNRVAFDTTDDQLGTQPSNADAIPLLRQGSAQPVTAANSLQSKRSAAIKRKTDKGSGEDASEPTLQAVLEDWDPPNDKAAKLAHVKTHYHHELFSLSDTKTEDLAEFGQGLALYFYFLKWTAMLLAAMSVVVLPNMIWSAIARNGGTSTTGLLVATSLGAYGPLFGSDYVYNATALEDDLMSLGVTFPNNQLQRELELEFYYQNASVADATVHIPLGRSVSKQQLHLWACYLDLASVLLYLIVVIFISLYQQRVLEEVASKTVTVVDYSVQVWDLPKDVQTAEVQTYFSQWGPVNSCQLAHNDSALIALVSRQGPLQAGRLHTLIPPQYMQCEWRLPQLTLSLLHVTYARSASPGNRLFSFAFQFNARPNFVWH